jgi:hypothetical protein
MAVLGVKTLATRLGEHDLRDPFAAFADLFPGQPLDIRVLKAEKLSCYLDTLPALADVTERCTRALPTGPFSQINVTSWDGVVKSLDLRVRENGLSVGDLSLQWGYPEVHFYGNWVTLSWPKQHITGVGWSTTRHFTYFQALSFITLEV